MLGISISTPSESFLLLKFWKKKKKKEETRDQILDKKEWEEALAKAKRVGWTRKEFINYFFPQKERREVNAAAFLDRLVIISDEFIDSVRSMNWKKLHKNDKENFGKALDIIFKEIDKLRDEIRDKWKTVLSIDILNA